MRFTYWISKGWICCLALMPFLEVAGCDRAPAATMKVPEFDSSVVEYFLTQGAQVQGVVVTRHEVSGYGFSASEELSANAVVLQVPAHQILCLEQIRHGPMSMVLHLLDNAFDLTADDTGMFWPLALTVMFERHQNKYSKWRPYMDYLPSMSSMPLSWNESTIQAAALYPYATQMVYEIQELADSVARFIFPQLYAHHPKAFSMFGVEGLHGLSSQQIREWRNSVATVWSRSFLLELGGSDQWGLVPLADLLNHCTGEQNNYLMAAPTPHLDVFELRTAHALRKGQELCINYGNHTSMQFFLFYGFVPSSQDFIGTPVDYIFLQFPLRDLLVRTAGQAGFREPLPLELSNVKIRFGISRAVDGAAEFSRQVCDVSWFAHVVASITQEQSNTTAASLPSVVAQSIVDDFERAIVQAMNHATFPRGTSDRQRLPVQCPTTGVESLPAQVDERLKLLRCAMLSEALRALGSIRASWKSTAQEPVPPNHCPGPDSTRRRIVAATKFQGLSRNSAIKTLVSRSAVANERLAEAGPAVDIVDVDLRVLAERTIHSDVVAQPNDRVQCVSKPTAERALEIAA